MAFPPNAGNAVVPATEVRPKTYIIHYPGGKNKKLKGFLRVVEDHVLGQTFLVGEELLGTLDVPVKGQPGRVKTEHAYGRVRYNITGATLTTR